VLLAARRTPDELRPVFQSDAGGESTLDIQTIMGVAPMNKHFFWSVGGPGPAKPPGQGAYILEWAKEVCSSRHSCHIVFFVAAVIVIVIIYVLMMFQTGLRHA
jgi:hypothetical protein